MSRTLVWSLATVAVVCLIAIVQAQDSGQFEPTPAAPLKDPSPTVAPRSDNATASRQRGSLLDRLKSIRQGTQSDQSSEELIPVDDQSPTIAIEAPITTESPRRSTLPGTTGGSSVLLKPKSGSSPAAQGTGTSSSGGTSGEVPSVQKAPIDRKDFSESPAPAASDDSDADTRSSSRRPKDLTPIDRSVIPTKPTVPTNPTSSLTEPQGRVATRSPQIIQRSPDEMALTSRGPALQVDTTGPKAITINKPATYTVRVANLNDDVAREVMVAVNVPEWVNILGNRASVGSVRQPTGDNTPARIIWAIDRLAGRSNAELTLNVSTNENRPIDMVVDWAYRPESASARIAVQEPRLELALAGPVDVLFGDTPTYTVTVSNPGTGDAENVHINLPSEFGGGQRAVGTILAGQTQQFAVQLITKQAGEIGLRATAVGDGGLESDAVQKVLIRRAHLVVQAEGPPFKYAGSVAKYQVRIANEGDAMAQDVVAAIALPAGSKYLGGLQGAEEVDNGLRWSIGSMNPGTERLYDISCQLQQAGNAEFQAGARATGDLSAAAAAETTVEALADLKLHVNDPRGPKPVGENVVYEIHVVNRGTKAASNVKVVVQFSEGVEPVAIDGLRGELVPGQVIFEPIGQIDAGAELTFSVTARADQAGNHIYRTVLSCSEPETRRVSEGTTKFFGEQDSSTAGRSDFQVPTR